MLTKFFFNRMSPTRKLAFLRKKGTFIGNRMRDSNLVSLYMLSDSFVEIVFPGSNSNDHPEQIRVFSCLERLNVYLEEEARLNQK